MSTRKPGTRSMRTAGAGERRQEPVAPSEPAPDAAARPSEPAPDAAPARSSARKVARKTARQTPPKPARGKARARPSDERSDAASLRDAAGLLAAQQAMLVPLKAALAETQALIAHHEAVLREAMRHVAASAPADREAAGEESRTAAAPQGGTDHRIDPFAFAPGALALFMPAQEMTRAGTTAWADAVRQTQAFWLGMAEMWLRGPVAGRSGGTASRDASQPRKPKGGDSGPGA